MLCVITVQNIHNGTVLLNNPMMVEESHYFWWKASIIFLDIFGLTFNGLGIDMIWHGVEVNHAVYFVILQDLCLAFLTTLASQIFNWFFWYDDLLWFRFYGLLAMLPFIFHNWAWASVAQLRYIFLNSNSINIFVKAIETGMILSIMDMTFIYIFHRSIFTKIREFTTIVL